MTGATGREFGRFLLVGASNTLVSYLAFEACLAALPAVAGREAWAQFIGYAVGTACAYLLHGRYTFRQRQVTPWGFARYAAVQAVLAAATAKALGVMVVFGLPVRPSWVAVTGLAAVVNYLGVKRLVFSGTRAAAQG